MSKELIVGVIVGAIAGSAATYIFGKKHIKKEVENEILDELDQIEKDFDDQVKEYSDLHDYALDHNESYKATVQEFYEKRDKARHADVDATNQDVEKAVLKEAAHKNKTDYTEFYENKSVEVIKDNEEAKELDEATEAFSDFVERMAKEKPIHYVTREEYMASPAKEFFDETDFIYFVKDGKVVDDEWNLQSFEDLCDTLGPTWRNTLSRDGHLWVIDYATGYMSHMGCNHLHTYESAYEKACERGEEDKIYLDDDYRIIGVDYEGDEDNE